jgi:hypothetical protein
MEAVMNKQMSIEEVNRMAGLILQAINHTRGGVVYQYTKQAGFRACQHVGMDLYEASTYAAKVARMASK